MDDERELGERISSLFALLVVAALLSLAAWWIMTEIGDGAPIGILTRGET